MLENFDSSSGRYATSNHLPTGAPSHWALTVREFLELKFPYRWTDTMATVATCHHAPRHFRGIGGGVSEDKMFATPVHDLDRINDVIVIAGMLKRI
jgi:hypothetical protein